MKPYFSMEQWWKILRATQGMIVYSMNMDEYKVGMKKELLFRLMYPHKWKLTQEIGVSKN